jgi:uncharacterized protein (DUF1778 family)
MNLQLTIPAEDEARLRERAAAAGKPVEEFVLDAVAEKLADSSAPKVAATPLRGKDWQREFDALLAAAPKVAHVVDDSRESIYEGRGE